MSTSLQTRLFGRRDLQWHLFEKGFLITNAKLPSLQAYPFYGNWSVLQVKGFHILVHGGAGRYTYEKDGAVYFLIGHAYNPFSMEWREDRILQTLAENSANSLNWNLINQLTGIFIMGVIRDDSLDFWLDASGMQYGCYGTVDGKQYISSHMQLVGDLCRLKTDPYVDRLIHYRWYHYMMGNYLPGELTRYSELKRIIPNTYVRFDGRGYTVSRIYPSREIRMCQSPEDYDSVIAQACEIMQNTMKLIPEKWERPAISLTGGIDSNTTFAAANGNYDKFEAFSYISAEKEIRDAEAAKKIAEHFDVPHHVYTIPDDDAEIEKFDEIYEVLMHNNSYVGPLKHNEARKRMYLRKHCGCEIEVKSWVSETIRAYWYKHYGRKTMPALSPKLYRNFYKIFIGNRVLAHKIDRLYEDYIRDFEYENIPEGYPTADMNFNEVTWGSWGGLRISEMKYCFDLTFAYNNRKFFNLMFRVPLDKRISDQHHLDMKAYLNKELADMNIRIVNMKETDSRAAGLNAIFTANMLLPF